VARPGCVDRTARRFFVVHRSEVVVRPVVFVLSFLLLTPLASCTPERSSAAEVDPGTRGVEQRLTKIEELDAHIRQAMQDWRVPGLAITVVQGDSVWFTQGYGVRRRGQPEPVDTRTLFGLLSPTKTFTTTALALLVEDGRLSWDDPVVAHLPHFRVSDPEVTRELRIRDLVNNGSGYPDSPWMWYFRKHDRQELVRRLSTVKPAAPPGSEFHYNNLMFVVAGEVIEAVSGLSWDDFVQQRIFEPLGMVESTTSVRALDARENVASPHTRRFFSRFGSPRPIRYFKADNIGPAGMIHTNVHEMADWLRLHLNEGAFQGEQLLSPAAVRELQRAQIQITDLGDEQLGGDRALAPTQGFLGPVAYGLGWFVTEYRGLPAVFHGGGINGQRSAVGLLPEEGVGVAILSNMQDTEIALALMYQVFDLFLDVEPRDWSAAYRSAN
jgi:CubicO group peptidase (beta-lactamase class C family)